MIPPCRPRASCARRKIFVLPATRVEACESNPYRFEQKVKQSGLTISISNPVVTAVQTAQQMKQAASDTGDPNDIAPYLGRVAATNVGALRPDSGEKY